MKYDSSIHRAEDSCWFLRHHRDVPIVLQDNAARKFSELLELLLPSLDSFDYFGMWLDLVEALRKQLFVSVLHIEQKHHIVQCDAVVGPLILTEILLLKLKPVAHRL